MLCYVQLVPGFGPMQLVPDFGPTQGTRSQSVSFGLWFDGGGKASVSPDLGPMQWARPSSCLYVIVWYVVVWGSSLSFVLTVFSFGFRYSVFKRGAREDCSAHTIVS